MTVWDNIFANIKTALEAIEGVDRVQSWLPLRMDRLGKYVTISMRAGAEEVTGHSDHWYLTRIVTLRAWNRVKTLTPSDTANDLAEEDMVKDIDEAMMTDALRGGYALATRMVSVAPLDFADSRAPMVGVEVVYEIDYHHKAGDRTSL